MISLLVLQSCLSNQKPAKSLMISLLVLPNCLLKQITLFSFNTYVFSNKSAFVKLIFKFTALSNIYSV